MLPIPVLLLIAASGVTNLVYQIIWQRLLVFSTGSGGDAVAAIVAAFMIGLGLGGLAGGQLADRLGLRARLGMLAGCETAIALSAVSSAGLYYESLYGVSATLPLAGVLALSVAATIVPAFFAGMTLPLSVRIVADDDEAPDRWPAMLYGVNTLGAAAGAFAAVQWLLPAWGFAVTLQIGALINVTCGAGAALLAIAAPRGAARAPAPPAAVSPVPPWWLAAFALSGFIALSLEIVWFRVLGVILHADSGTFARLLSVYLAGTGLGALAARSSIARRWPARRAFFVLQSIIPVHAVIALGLMVLAANVMLSESGLPPPWLPRVAAGLIAAIALVGVPTFLMGLSFGYLQRAVHSDVAGLGRRVGALQSANIAGAAAGALITGLVLLDRLGTPGTLRTLVAAGGCFAFPLLIDRRTRARRVAIALAVGIAALAIVPGRLEFWSTLHGGERALVLLEDRSGVVVLKGNERDGITVLVNGQPQSDLPYGGIHTALGALPVLLHHDPRSVAVIGLGSGATAFAIGGRAETARIDVIEIVAPVRAALAQLTQRWSDAGLRGLLADPRVTHVIGDGRLVLQRSGHRYDVIEADALLPQNAYAGNLYSREYFALLRERLTPGGFGVTWLPTERVLASMRAEFPHVTVIGEIGIGTNRPLRIDAAALAVRLSNARLRAYYQAAGIDIEQLVDQFMDVPIADYTKADSADLNEDLFPRDELTRR